MEPRHALGLCCAALAWAGVQPALAAGHCDAAETTYFSCSVRNSPKTISLCGAAPRKDADAPAGGEAWLQYRFGELGQVEFAFPAERLDALANFTGEWQYRADGQVSRSAALLMFRHQGATFTLASVDAETKFRGVWLEVERIRAPELVCNGPPAVDRLQEAIQMVKPAR